MMGEILTIIEPKVTHIPVPHITEEEMRKQFSNIRCWLSDEFGIVEVGVIEDEQRGDG